MRRILSVICLVVLLFTVGYVQSAYSSDEGMVISDKMTYGMVKKYIKIGETTQADILKLFGSPDNMTMDKGKEMWIYDRFSVESESSSTSGFGTIILAGASGNSAKNSTQIKTLTVIINFDKNNVVEDYSMREGGY